MNLAYRCLLAMSLLMYSSGILIGRLRDKEGPASNIVSTGRLVFSPPDDDGGWCKTDDGLSGICVDIRHCPSVRSVVQSGNHPVRCAGWVHHFVPKVCCHHDQVTKWGWVKEREGYEGYPYEPERFLTTKTPYYRPYNRPYRTWRERWRVEEPYYVT